MSARKVVRVDWLALAQRVCVLARSMRGDAIEAIESDHALELERGEKVRGVVASAERWATERTQRS